MQRGSGLPQPGTVVSLLAAVSLSTLAVAACSGGSEQSILNQFFGASRLRDKTTLQSFARVAFEPRLQGTINRFVITSVAAEQRKPLNRRALTQEHDDAKAEGAEFAKHIETYRNENLDAIRRVLKAEGEHATLKGKDAEVQAAWTRFREEGALILKRISEAQRELSSESGIVELSVEDQRNTIDITKWDGDLVSKEVTIAAPVRLPDGGTAQKTLVVTMQRAVLKGDKEIVGRWIITRIKDTTALAATKTS